MLVNFLEDREGQKEGQNLSVQAILTVGHNS